MDKCKKYSTNILFNFIYDLVSDKDKKDMQIHINKCPDCAEKVESILNVKKVVQDTPKLNYDKDVLSIINKAEHRKEEKSSIFNIFRNFNFKLQYGLATAIIMIFISLYFFLTLEHVPVYIIKAQGNVVINNKAVIKNTRYKYDLADNMDIKIQNGECAIQIKNKKLILIKDNTELILKEKNDHEIDLKKGKIICSVNNKGKGMGLIINSGDIEFKIIGTEFFVNRGNDFVECGVKKGKVSAFYNKEKYIISDKKLFIKNKKGIQQTDLVKNKLNCFDKLDNIRFINDLPKSKKIKIQGLPKNSSIYRGFDIVGETPLFIRTSSKLKDEMFIIKKGFIPLRIPMTGNDKFYFKLEKLKNPKLIKKTGFNDTVLLRPVKVKDYLIIPTLNGVYKFDLIKSKNVWEYKTKNRISHTPIYKNNILYFASNDNYFYAIDFNTGDMIWKKRIDITAYSLPYIYKSRIYFGTTTGKLVCLDMRKGKFLWEKQFSKGFFSSAVINNDILYIGNFNGYIYGINVNNRKIVWKLKTQKIIGASPVIKNNLLYFSSKNHFFCIDINNKYSIKWRYKTDGDILTSPGLLEDLVVFSSSRGTIYAFDRKSGVIRWKRRTGYKIISDPLILHNRFISFCDKKNNIYVLNKYGFLYSLFKFDFTAYYIFNNHLIVFNEDKYIYNFLLDIKS